MSSNEWQDESEEAMGIFAEAKGMEAGEDILKWKSTSLKFIEARKLVLAAATPQVSNKWFDIFKSYFRRSTDVRLTRPSLDKLPQDDGIDPDFFSSFFSFQNRKKECKELIGCFIAMDSHFTMPIAEGAQRNLRSLYFPLVVAPPGTGKTTFSRRGLTHYFKNNNIKPSAAEELLFKAFNIRIDCKLLKSGGDNFDILTSCAALILVESFKYNIRDSNTKSDINTYVLKKLALSDDITMTLIINYIFTRTKTSAIIINFDEVQELAKGHLDIILTCIYGLMTNGLKIYPIITGLFSKKINHHVSASSYGHKYIYLSPLQLEHDVNILDDIFDQKCTADILERCRPFEYALWLIGGVPRLLGQFLRAICLKHHSKCLNSSGFVNVIGLKETCGALSLSIVFEILKSIQHQFSNDALAYDGRFYGHLVALCLTETEVPLHLELAGEKLTVLKAALMQLCYVIGTKTSGLFKIYIAPFYLQYIYGAMSTQFCKIPLLEIGSTLDSRANEAILLQSIKYKIHALKLRKINKIKVFELLGLRPGYWNPTIGAIMKTEVLIDSCDLMINVSRKNILSVNKIDLNQVGYCWVNSPHASYCDSCLILRYLINSKLKKFFIFMQAKLSTIDMLKNNEGATASQGLTDKEIIKEYNLIKGDNIKESNHIFIIFGDGRARHPRFVHKNVLVIDSSMHENVLGSVLNGIRKMNSKISSIDILETSSVSGSKRKQSCAAYTSSKRGPKE